MLSYGSFRLFFLKTSFGLLFITCSIILFAVFAQQGIKIGEFKNIPLEYYYKNLFYYYLALVSNIVLVFLGLAAYLIPIFLMIMGTRLLLGIKTELIALRFILLLFSISILNFSLSLSFVFGSGLLGETLVKLVPKAASSYFANNLILFFITFLTSIFSIVITLISLDIKLKRLKIFNNIAKKILKFFFYILSSFKHFISYLLFKKKKITETRVVRRKGVFKKSEPTLKNNKKIIKKNNGENSNYLSKAENTHYALPPLTLLKTSKEKNKSLKEFDKKNSEFASRLETVLKEYGVDGKVVNFRYGPVVTLYEFLPAAGIKTSKVVGLSDDIARAMSSLSARISAQPGKTSIGIEIPNLHREDVLLGDLINDEKFLLHKNGLALALGKNISGEKKFTDLEKMPHLLIAGTTGSGKSVGINAMIVSLLYKFTPSECKLILIDPKMLELSIYEDIPHLLTPVVTNPNKAVFALKWVVREMENRYRLMSSLNVKKIDSFNAKIVSALSAGRKLFREVQTGIDRDTRLPIIEKIEIPLEKMPLIVVVIDEMADLMMVAGKEVESLVQRLAQMARASGIHLIAATQRPSVDVITGTIKANFPSRISFRVASRFDSRTILNEMGAEQLLGSGDMLFLENGANLTRLHGGFVSESEIENIVNHIKSQSNYESPKDITLEEVDSETSIGLDFNSKDVDELYEKALSIILEQQKVSTSFIQRYLQIGYNRAARIVEKMEEDGYISEANNAGKRNVLKTNK